MWLVWEGHGALKQLLATLRLARMSITFRVPDIGASGSAEAKGGGREEEAGSHRQEARGGAAQKGPMCFLSGRDVACSWDGRGA